MVSLRFAAITLLAVAFVAVQAHPVQKDLPDLSKRQMEGGPGDDASEMSSTPITTTLHCPSARESDHIIRSFLPWLFSLISPIPRPSSTAVLQLISILLISIGLTRLDALTQPH
ncbi:hypothetical protein BJ085DRAFT_28188 [Dimargaris cristalligena]|uniref:Uncharacterized protein n=1 Tax=Dimargaris cristalligena TaxID=215637 RepID=A0A4P9ZPM4_9FUNG|nr:hypothetical protein BJ085DRAFT_28188 [Dimargaris cristalligena]|eukprot:RKP35386.1 hypothetical protein BJ085DRAFT_28188 [Dimargaris cristalligena]